MWNDVKICCVLSMSNKCLGVKAKGSVFFLSLEYRFKVLKIKFEPGQNLSQVQEMS